MQRSTVAQKCHGNFNLLTAISICSRQFQFVHGNFNLLKAISICSQQLQQQFHFAHGNFNLLTAISIFSRQCYSIFRFAHYLSTMAADSDVATKHQLKHKIESPYLKSIFFTAPRKLLALSNNFIYCTASQNGAIPHINLSIEAKVLFTDVIGSSLPIFAKKEQKWWSHTKEHAIYGPSLRFIFCFTWEWYGLRPAWDWDELRPPRICNFCSRLHETGTKHFVEYMRPVQTQKQEILVAI